MTGILLRVLVALSTFMTNVAIVRVVSHMIPRVVTALKERRESPSARAARPISEDEEYAIYSAAIRGLFGRELGYLGAGSPQGGSQGVGAGPAFIREQTFTPNPEWSEWEDPGERIAHWTGGGSDVDKSAVESFKSRIGASVQLKGRFELPGGCILLSDQKLKQMRVDGSLERYLYKERGDSPGIIALSRVGLNSSHDEALVYIENECGGLCGAGYYLFLTNSTGEWLISHRDMIWIS